MKFYLDHDVDVTLAMHLRQWGHDVLTTRETSHTAASDEYQLIFATQEGRIFITHNRRDFRRLHRQWIDSARIHSGIIISTHLPLEELERRLLRLFSAFTVGDMQGQLIPLHEFR